MSSDPRHSGKADDGTASDDRLRDLDLPTTRRDVLRATGASAAGLAAGSVAAGTTAASDDRGIPTPKLEVREVEGEDAPRKVLTDPSGNEVTLRGVNIADPKRIDVTADARGKTALQVIDALTDPNDGEQGWHPRVIRVPVQPIDIGEHEPGHTGGPPDPPAFTLEQLETYVADHLDPVVDYLEELGFYCIVDFHRHWQGLRWDEPALHDEVVLFWDYVAAHYADRDHVIFEVYNEPTEPGIWGDPVAEDYWAGLWRDFHDVVDPWVATIREHADNLVIVGSPSWTQTPEGYYVEHFDYENVGYTYHIYPGHTVSQNHNWDEVGTDGAGTQALYEDIPLFVTEFGWQNDLQDRYLAGTTSDYGDPILDWMEGEGQWSENGDLADNLHWTAWCGDPIWLPAMFERPFTDSSDTDSIGHPYEDEIPVECPDLPCDWHLLGSDGNTDDYMGQRIKDALYEYRDDGVPQAGVEAPSNLRVTEGPTADSVTVAWDAPDAEDVAEYNVYVDGALDHDVDAGTTDTTVDGLDSATTYEIGVSTVNGEGDESTATTLEVTTERGADDPPAAPTNLTASVDGTDVALDWDASEHDVDGYRVYVDGSLDHDVGADQTSTSVGGLSQGTTYEFGVAAFDDAGESELATVEATTEVSDAAPTVDQFDVSDRSGGPWSKARVQWAVSDAEGALDQLEVALVDSSGATVDSATQSLSGGSASGKHDLREKNGGGEYTVELSVTDQAGNVTTASETRTL